MRGRDKVMVISKEQLTEIRGRVDKVVQGS